MEKILETIGYPYVQKMPSSHLIESFDRHRQSFREEMIYLLKLRLPPGVAHHDAQSRLRFIGWKPIPLLMQIILEPLIVRFNFHFYGQQKTNDRRKVRQTSRISCAQTCFSPFSPNGISIKSSAGFSIMIISSRSNCKCYSTNRNRVLRWM